VEPRMEPAKIACKYGVNWRRGWRVEFHQMTIPGQFCNLRDGSVGRLFDGWDQ
jgi:hypothetical protein